MCSTYVLVADVRALLCIRAYVGFGRMTYVMYGSRTHVPSCAKRTGCTHVNVRSAEDGLLRVLLQV